MARRDCAELFRRRALLDQAEEIARTLPHREAVLMINHRHARRQLESERLWLDELIDALRGQ
jgi:hypothetical protein